MTADPLRQLGWKPFFQQQLPETPPPATVVRVAAHFGSQVMVVDADGERPVPAVLAEAAGDVAVGDWLVLNADQRAVLRLERETELTRKAAGTEVKPQVMAANIDTLFIVSSCNEEFNLSRLERYLALTLQAGAQPVVVLTKRDLCEDPVNLRRQAERLRPGLLVETIDARNSDEVDALRMWCRAGQTVALLGSSGVGKSTLASTLGAGELATGAIREKDGKGRHTTTSRSLHRLPTGGVLIDTPGMRELQLTACEAGVAEVFDDIVELAENCRFRNCRHDGDAGCAVAAAVADGSLDPRRFNSFMKLSAEQAHNERSLAERRARSRRFGRQGKSILAAKQRNKNLG